MGTLTNDSVDQTKRYGGLALRFNALRDLYNCVRVQMNDHKSLEKCL